MKKYIAILVLLGCATVYGGYVTSGATEEQLNTKADKDGTNLDTDFADNAGLVEVDGSNSVFNVANFVDTYNSTNWTAVLSWDAENKVFTVSETGVAE